MAVGMAASVRVGEHRSKQRQQREGLQCTLQNSLAGTHCYWYEIENNKCADSLANYHPFNRRLKCTYAYNATTRRGSHKATLMIGDRISVHLLSACRRTWHHYRRSVKKIVGLVMKNQFRFDF